MEQFILNIEQLTLTFTMSAMFQKVLQHMEAAATLERGLWPHQLF